MGQRCTAEDLELAARAQRGDGAAWAQIWRDAAPALRASAGRRLRNSDDADDVVSEVFARAAGAIDRYRADRPLVAWLHGIQRNVLLEHARRRVPCPAGLHLWPIADPEADPADIVMRAMDCALAVAAVRSLEATTRRVLYLRVCEGRPSSEVGAIIDIDAAAVRGMQSRGMRRVRVVLEGGVPLLSDQREAEPA